MNDVSQVNGEHRFGIHLHWAGFVRSELHKETMPPASVSITGENCFNSCSSRTHPQVSQFTFFLYVLGAFQTATLVLELRMSEFVSGLVCVLAISEQCVLVSHSLLSFVT